MANQYVALLRGINVGGIRIKMPDLKKCFEDAGCAEVKTYLQSGNVTFSHNEPLSVLKPLLENALGGAFHYEAYVLLYLQSSLAGVVAGYPFERDDEHHAYVVFVDDGAALADLWGLAQALDEPLRAGEGLIYWRAAKGTTLDTPFSKLTAKSRYKKCTTTRNVNTLELMVLPS